jgi:hypothetical protein
MTQEQFTDLIATSAVGLAPIMLAHGHISPELLKELAETAAKPRASDRKGRAD